MESEADPAVKNPAALEGAAAAIHLSGASVAAHRWTEAYKNELATSRLDSTRRLAKVLAALRKPPRAFLVASAIGIYGDRGDEVLTESSPPGSGFLADLVPAVGSCGGTSGSSRYSRRASPLWSRAGTGARRIAADAAAVSCWLGRAAGQRQAMDELGRADGCGCGDFVRSGSRELSGAVNVTSPNPVTNADFTRALGRQLHRPAFLTVPAFALRPCSDKWRMRRCWQALALQPAKLQAAGFQFSLPEIEGALRAALG